MGDRVTGPRVAILDDYQGAALGMADWGSLGGEIVAFADHLADEGALVERLAPFEVVVAMRERTPFPRRVLERLPALRLLVTTGGGNAAIDMAAARSLDIVVCGTALSVTPTLELTWALLMAARRGIVAEDRAVREGRWQLGVPVELAGSTLGILGFGRIGTRIARFAHAFDMRVLAWSRTLTTERAAAGGVEAVGFDELFERSDIVSVHLKLAPETRGIVGAAQLRRLGAGGHLVNTARGPIVDETALVAALTDGTIAGAGLDVFDEEPLPAGHPLLGTPNTVLSPHLGFVGAGSYREAYGEAVADIAAWLAGAPVRVLS